MEENKSQSFAVPVAIIVGFGLIAAAIFWSGKGTGPNTAVTIPGTGDVAQEATDQPSPEKINPVTEADHIRGNPNAQIVLVEYSDYDCPFCKNFHESMNQLMAEFGTGGRVAWVYRQFPLEQLHPNAPMIAQGAECVAKLGGNEAFWTFSDLIFDERGVNDPTDPSRIPEFVETAGVNIDEYNTCMENGETKAAVEEDFNNAIEIGARGTPHTIVMVGDQTGVINGAQPYSVVKGIVEDLLTQLDGGSVDSQ